MKVTENIIERICDLRYNKIPVRVIAPTVDLSEKWVRRILKKYYTPTYVKIRAMTQPGNDPWSSSQVHGELAAKINNRYDKEYAHQDVNCRVPEHQQLLEKINEQEQTIKTDKETDQKKDKLLKQKDETIEDALTEIQRLRQINLEHEKKDKDHETVIQKKDQDILFLKNIALSGIQGIQHNVADIKIQLNTGIRTVRDDIGTLTTAHNQLNRSFQTHHNTTTLEKIKIEQELQTLKEKHSNDLLKYGVVAGTSFGVGTLITQSFPQLLETIISWGNKLIKNTSTGYTGTPIKQPGVIQADGHSIIHRGETPVTLTSGTLYSGASINSYGETYRTGYNTVPNQQDATIQPDLHSEVNLVTNPSGTQCSGAEYSSHAEILPLQNVQPIPVAPLRLIPITNSYSFAPRSPPNDIWSAYLMKQLRNTTGRQFEKYLELFFKHLGYQVTLTKASGDEGADLILTLAWEKIVIQAKQWKEPVGTIAIQEVCAAQKACHATRAIVITTSEFTKSAIKFAKKVDVECWDGKKLIEELYNHQFFLLPS